MYVRVSVCGVNTPENTHSGTDADGLSRNSSSRLCLLRGGEGGERAGGKINKTSLLVYLVLVPK